MARRDYYDVLGVGREASDPQIRSAYRKLARKYHPDVNKSPGARDRFQEATEAYEVLSDPKKRSLYDEFGHGGPGEGFGAGAGRACGPTPGRAPAGGCRSTSRRCSPAEAAGWPA